MDLAVGLIAGLVFGLLIGWGTAYNGIVERCESNLPRSKNCILIAVPDRGE